MKRWLPLTLGLLFSSQSAAEPRTTAPAAAPRGAQAPKSPAQAGHSCEAEAIGMPPEDRVAQLKDPKTGASVLAAGAKLSGVPAVSIGDLLKNPDAWSGKTVRLEGNVSAMCTHRRAWFAIQADDKSGAYVRVIAAPNFLVPEGSIGKRARTEGRVEVTEVPAEAAQHYTQEHQLAAQPKAVLLRATGAEFL